MNAPRRAICLSLDALTASYLGPYGNTWIHTPGFNRLAAESLVLDRLLIETASLTDAFTSLWTGIPPWQDAGKQDRVITKLCRTAKIQTALITDEPELVAHPLAHTFDKVVPFPLPSRADPVMHWEDSAMAKFFAGAIDWLENHSNLGLVWIHAGALAHVWDAPLEFREAYADEDDPPPAKTVIPPVRRTASFANPDELLALRHAYAGQVSVLDQCLQWFLDGIATIFEGESPLLVVHGLRGYPLGEHAAVGLPGAPFFSELTQGACFIRDPQTTAAGRGSLHSSALTQPRDLHATLCEWFNLDDLFTHARDKPIGVPNQEHDVDETASETVCHSALSSAHSMLSLLDGRDEWPRMLSVARCRSGEVALTTPAWYFCFARSHVERSSLGEIYAKPDDYFEANEVSGRCQDEVSDFHEVLRQIDAAPGHGPFDVPLSQRLVQAPGTILISAPHNGHR